jgi:predicted dehydrogenase
VDCSIIAAAAKSAAPAVQAVEICRDRGRLVNVGAVELSFPYGPMYMKEIRLFMARAYGPGSYDEKYEKHGVDYPLPYVRWTENRNMEEFLRLVETGAVQLQPMITHEFSLDEAPKAYDIILDPAGGSLAVLLKYPAADSPRPDASFDPLRKLELSPVPEGNDLRVALAGAGNIARWAHLPGLKKARGAKLHAVYSASGVRGRTYASRFGASYCTTDYDELLRDEDTDMIMIVSRHQFHFDQALAALNAGKHVFLEKPMALTEKECRLLHKAVEETGKQIFVGFNRRFAPFYKALKRHVDRRPGPAVMNCRINSPGLAGSFWGADPEFGGAILGEAVHFVDLMYWLTGSEPVGVSAFSLPRGKDEPIGMNNMAASFHFADGSIGNFTYCTVGSSTSGGERVEVFTQGGACITEDFKSLLVKRGTVRKSKKMFPAKGYDEQMKSFINSLRKGETPEITVVDGARATIGALRMLESARTLSPCSIDVAASLK